MQRYKLFSTYANLAEVIFLTTVLKFLKSILRGFWAPLRHFNIKDDKFIVLNKKDA